jgi:hypothetical protein
MKNKIRCALCGLLCSMQVSASHLRAAHSMTTKEYKALGHKTLSPARLAQLRATLTSPGARGRYGPEHWNWKGGHVTSAGYRVISRRGRAGLLEHRVVAEKMLGRPLGRDEIVHHVDGNRANNAPENLVVMSRGEHDKLKDGTRAYFHTGPVCEEAARVLLQLGWSKSKVQRALRIHHATLERWLTMPQTPT